MIRNSCRGRGVSRRLAGTLGVVAAALLALLVPGQRAEALSLVNPAAVPQVKYVSDGLMTEVHGHGGGGGGFRGGFHGGGGGGGFRGAAVFHGGGYRTGPVFRGGGVRYGAVRYGGYRAVHYGGYRYGGYRFAHRHFHRRFYGAAYYGYPYYDDYPYYYPYRRCRLIWTYYGPRRVCHFRHWHPHYWRHHHHHHRFYW